MSGRSPQLPSMCARRGTYRLSLLLNASEGALSVRDASFPSQVSSRYASTYIGIVMKGISSTQLCIEVKNSYRIGHIIDSDDIEEWFYFENKLDFLAFKNEPIFQYKMVNVFLKNWNVNKLFARKI